MKKIFKKSLAIMVSAAICLTALIGCLSVSAANGEAPVYTVATVEGKKGETVDVNVTGADLTEICGQDLSIIFAAGLTIGTVHDNITNDDLVCDPDGDGMQYNVIVNDDGTNTLKMVDIINFPEYTGSPELVTGTFDVTISVTIPADAAAGTEYPITIDESQFADYDEAWVEPTLTNGKITVVEDVIEPVLDESISAIRAIRIQDTVGVSYLVPKAAMSKYADFRIEIKYNKFDGDYNYTQTSMIINKSDDEAPAEGVVHGFTFPGVGMYEMNNELEAVIYALDGEGNVVAYSNTFKDSIVALAKNLYSTTDSVKTKTLITDLLNMGAEAQKYFVAMKPNSDLASVPLANEGFDQTYATAEISKDDLNTIFSNDVIKGDISMVNALSFAGSPCVSYVITGVSNYDVSKLSLTVSYRDDYAGKDVSVTLNGNEIAFGGSMCIYAFSNTALYDGNKVVTAELSYDGEVYIRNTCTVEKILSDKFDDPTTSELAKSTAKFGKSAREYFGIN